MFKNSQPPLWSPVDKSGTSLNRIWQQWFSLITSFLNGLVDYTETSIQTPVTGFTINIPDGLKVLTLTPAGQLATGTIVMPPNPLDGQVFRMSTTNTIISLAINPNTGQTVSNQTGVVAAGRGATYYYNKVSATWLKLA